MQGEANQQLKARVRLALRAERAMGLKSLPIELTGDASNRPSRPATVPESRAPAARPLSTQRAPAPPAEPRPAPPTPAGKPHFFDPPPMPAFNMPTEPYTAPVLAREQKIVSLKTLDEQHVSCCTKCRLHETRTKTVFGEGDADARLMFIGEGPGQDEDLQGRPFVGRAGQLLNKMIAAMGLAREQVFICNIVKCRPPGNREPAPDETASCTPYLLQQIEIVRPQVIVPLGRPASQFLLQTKSSMGQLRGKWQMWRGIRVMPTYHPAYVLRQYTRQTREAVWSDLQQVMSVLNPSSAPSSKQF